MITKSDFSALCRECRFEDVLPVWSSELWPGRTSAIEPTSAMKWLGGIDMSLMNSKPTFWCVSSEARTNETSSDARTIGVLSGHFGGIISTDSGTERAYRTRGLWVAPESRGKGVARTLMQAAFEQASTENCTLVWTFPRQTSMPFYKSMGFSLVGSWIGNNDPRAGEFGPNGFALANTDRHESSKTP